jgi:hypothetical protein
MLEYLSKNYYLQFKNIGAGAGVVLTDDTVNNVIAISVSSTTSPGGNVGSVQFNSNAGSFTGNSNFVWDYTNNNKLTVIGNITSTNFSSSITNAVGYFGTASYSNNALSSSYALTSSNSITSSYALTASYVSSDINVSGLGGLSSNVYQYSESPSQLSTYVASGPYYYEISHGFGSIPSLIRITALCTIGETTLGYSVGDEIDISNLQILDNNWDRVKSITWSNLTKVGISFTTDTHCLYLPYKYTGGSACMTTANWKIVIRTWK